jgi:transcription elongation factor Elf1
MQSLAEHHLNCPYCGENISVLIESSIEQQEYIEDCQVCCRPITFKVQLTNEGGVSVAALHENE